MQEDELAEASFPGGCLGRVRVPQAPPHSRGRVLTPARMRALGRCACGHTGVPGACHPLPTHPDADPPARSAGVPPQTSFSGDKARVLSLGLPAGLLPSTHGELIECE